MPNWFVYTADGTKKGPFTSAQLKVLADSGKIIAETILETDNGHKGKAGQVKGLFPPAEPTPFGPKMTPAATAGAFCTNCGNSISPQAVACMKCGADPRANKNFCRTCGAQLNPNQVVCVKCGSAVSEETNNGSRNAGFNSALNALKNVTATNRTVWKSNSTSKNKTTAALLAFFLGPFGSHKFYMGSWGWGVVYIVMSIVATFVYTWISGNHGHFRYSGEVIIAVKNIFIGCAIPALVSIIEGIIYLVTSDKAFVSKYSDETTAPFRW